MPNYRAAFLYVALAAGRTFDLPECGNAVSGGSSSGFEESLLLHPTRGDGGNSWQNRVRYVSQMLLAVFVSAESYYWWMK